MATLSTDPEANISYLDRIAELNDRDLRRFVPLVVGDAKLGWVRRDRIPVLEVLPGVFELSEHAIELRSGEDFDARTDAFRLVADHLVATAEVGALCDEMFPALGVDGGELWQLDRTIVPWFGLPSRGVHLNGFVRTDQGLEMWIGHRSAGKTTFPGMLDNLVAGGQPVGLSVRANLIKECAEEAAIGAELAGSAVPVSAVSYAGEDDRGMKPDTMFCFDLELPESFVPRNTDGEIDHFERLPLGDVAEIVANTTRFKPNCNLVVIDFLVRYGFLSPDDPDYGRIVTGLRQAISS